MMKQEINWINAVRAFCIVLVFLAHSVEISGQGIPGWLYRMYDPVYVNAFFFVSGYLLMDKQLSAKKLSGNILFRLMIPSVLFATIEYFPKKLLRGGLSISSFLMETVGGGTYWFLSALAVAQLLYVILLLTRIRNIWFFMACSVAFAVVGMTLIGDEGFKLWCYRQGLVCTLFLASGGIYQRYEKSLEAPVWLLAVLICVYVAGSIWNPGFIGGYSVYHCLVSPTGYVWSMLGTVCLVEICKRLPQLSILTFTGRNSILFYMMSGALPSVFTIVLQRIGGVNIFTFLLIFMLSLTLAYDLCRFIVRYLPFLKDLRVLK